MATITGNKRTRDEWIMQNYNLYERDYYDEPKIYEGYEVKKKGCISHKYVYDRGYRLSKGRSVYILMCHEKNCRNTIKCDIHFNNDYKICIYNDCDRRSQFGYINKKPLTCIYHKLDGMKKVYILKCNIEGCERSATHGPKGEAAIVCSLHKQSGYIDGNKRCQKEDCFRTATHGYKRNHPEFCRNHKSDGMKHKYSCTECDDLSYYGYNNIFNKCKAHKQNDMRHRYQCCFNGCERNGLYGYSFGNKLRQMCSEHKEDNMKKYRACSYYGCYKKIYSGKGIYCSNHCDEGNTFDKICIEPGCTETRIYGYPGFISLYCINHKKENMKITAQVLCANITCYKHAAYGYERKRPAFCSNHALKDMINVIYFDDGPFCMKRCCFNKPIYGSNEIPFRCFEHRRPEDKLCLEYNTYTKGLYLAGYLETNNVSLNKHWGKIMIKVCTSSRLPDIENALPLIYENTKSKFLYIVCITKRRKINKTICENISTLVNNIGSSNFFDINTEFTYGCLRYNIDTYL